MGRRALLALLLMLAGPWGAPPPAHAQRSWASHIPAERAVQRLLHPEPAVREAAARALGAAGDPHRARVALLEALASERVPRVRAAIARSLAIRAHPEALPELAHAFEEARGADVRALALAIAAVGTPEAAGILAQGLLREESASGARVALERMGLAAAPQLTRLLRDDPTAIAAIDLLGRSLDVESVPLLVELSRGDSPAVRRAALVALGRVGDVRARETVVAALGDPHPGVSFAAWEALPRVGAAEDAARVQAALREAEGDRRAALLRTLLVLDEARAVEVVVQWVGGDDAELVRVAGDVALEHPRPALVPVLYGLLREGSRRDEAAAALAEVQGGEGVGVLLREVELPAARRALAVALRRWSGALPRGVVRAARRALAAAHLQASGPAEARALVLRALAQDPAVAPNITRALRSPDPDRRAAAAHAAWLLADPSLRGPLEGALAEEQEPTAWRVMALALAALGGALDAGASLAALADPERAPEAAVLAAGSSSRRPRDRRRLGRALRQLLRGPDERARSSAAWSLAALGETSAWRALLARVDHDPSPVVRRAAARALAAVAPPEARERLLRRSYLEVDDEVRAWLERASRGGALPPPRGRQVLRFRVVTEAPTPGVEVDVVLPDGRWLRLPTLPSGELFLADLPEAVADVRVQTTVGRI